MSIGLILDTSALLSYSEGLGRVGVQAAETTDAGLSVLIPATCLAAAYRDATSDGWHYLDVLSSNPAVRVAPLEHDLCAVLGGWARTMGLDLAHAAIEAASYRVAPLMTTHRGLVTRFLPNEWPIIDVDSGSAP